MNARGNALAMLAIVLVAFILIATAIPAVHATTVSILNAIFH